MMRFYLLILLAASLVNCTSQKKIREIVDSHRQTFPLSQLELAIPDFVSNSEVTIVNNFALPERSEIERTGVSILPLLFYNHFYSSYEVFLGQDVLDERWGAYVDKRLESFASDLENNGFNHVRVEFKRAVAHGRYLSGFVMIVGAGNTGAAGDVSLSKDASAEVAINLAWLDNDGIEQNRDVSIKLEIMKNGMYSGHVRSLMGKTVAIAQNTIDFHFNSDIHAKPPLLDKEKNLTMHLFRISDLLVLCLDELCQTILDETREEVPRVSVNETELLQARNQLWEKIRGNKIGIKFIRGYSNSGGFRPSQFYDFVSLKSNITIDVGTNRKTFSVDRYLSMLPTSGFRHIYFTPEEVMEGSDGVLEKIKVR